MRIILVIILSLIIVSVCYPADENDVPLERSFRVYDKKGHFDGTIEKRNYGTYRVYDKKGHFKGTVEPTPYGQIRIYDEKGHLKESYESRPY